MSNCFISEMVTAQGSDMMTQIYRSSGGCAATVAAWRPPLLCLFRQISGPPMSRDVPRGGLEAAATVSFPTNIGGRQCQAMFHVAAWRPPLQCLFRQISGANNARGCSGMSNCFMPGMVTALVSVHCAALSGTVTVTTVPPPSLGAMVRLPPHIISSL